MAKAAKTPIKTEILSFRCYPKEKLKVAKAARRLKMEIGTFVKIAVLEKLQRSAR